MSRWLHLAALAVMIWWVTFCFTIAITLTLLQSRY